MERSNIDFLERIEEHFKPKTRLDLISTRCNYCGFLCKKKNNTQGFICPVCDAWNEFKD